MQNHCLIRILQLSISLNLLATSSYGNQYCFECNSPECPDGMRKLELIVHNKKAIEPKVLFLSVSFTGKQLQSMGNNDTHFYTRLNQGASSTIRFCVRTRTIGDFEQSKLSVKFDFNFGDNKHPSYSEYTLSNPYWEVRDTQHAWWVFHSYNKDCDGASCDDNRLEFAGVDVYKSDKCNKANVNDYHSWEDSPFLERLSTCYTPEHDNAQLSMELCDTVGSCHRSNRR